MERGTARRSGGWIGGLAMAIVVLTAPAAGAATPNTKITSGPEGLVASNTATFKFKATVSGASFECKIDGKNFSSCSSPKKYSRLKQGDHAFSVRARKGKATDSSPALREFTVDSVPPETTITSGPEGYTEDHSPSFGFESSEEPATFECRLAGDAFEACTSPFAPAGPLPDGFFTTEVRAKDAAGNVDDSAASRDFNPETPLTESLQTAETAALLYFPDLLTMDVPASCGSNPIVDCPNGTPVAPADQLSVSNSRALIYNAPSHRADLTATMGVQTLQPIKMTYAGSNCDVSLNSANGASPTVTYTVQLNFVVGHNTGKTYISFSNGQLTGLEAVDYTLTGDFLCNVAGALIPASMLQDQLEGVLTPAPVCAAPGPDYLGPCTSEP